MYYSEWLCKIYAMQQYLQQCMEPICKEYHLNGTEMTVLLFLHQNPKQNTTSDIAKYSSMTRGNITSAVERLTRRDLLIRVRDEQDRRIVHLCLSPTAECMIPDLFSASEQFLHGIFDGFTPEDIQAFLEYNTRVANNAEQQLQQKNNT